MAERSNNPNPGGLTFYNGRVPDNHRVRQPPRQLPLATREFVYGVAIVAVVLVLMVAGIAGWRP